MIYKKLKSYIPITFKAKTKKFFKYLKTRSLKELDSKASYKAHNSELEEVSAYEREVEIHQLKTLHTNLKNGIWNNVYASPESVGYFLDSNKEIDTLIDIGSGSGWFVNYVALNYSNIKSIIAIEPSKAGVDLSRKIYKNNTKINYLVGFSDKELKKIKNDIYLVTTFAVFQHLNKSYTKKVLKILSKKLLKGSVLYLAEPIAKSKLDTFRLHYPRTKKFWKRNLNDFEVSYFNDKLIVAKKIN